MDCNHARMLLIVCRDPADLDTDEVAALNSHLAQCGACRSWSESERRWENSVSRAMRAVPVPADLKGRLLTRLDKGRPLGRHWPAWVGAAAALLLTAGLSWFLLFSPKTQIDLALADYDVVIKLHASPESVEEWFRANHGVHLVAPRQLDYELLQSYDLATFHGRRVPRLYFQNRRTGKFAEVYVLSERHFDHDPDAPQQHSGTSLTVQMLEPAAGFRYLVVFSGDSLEPFLKFRNAV